VNDAEAHEKRVLVLAPTTKDAKLVLAILGEAHIACEICPTLRCLCDEIEHGAAAVLLPEEAIVPHRRDCLSEYLEVQPPWSDLPVLVMARHGADSTAVARAMDLLGNVTVLERPMRVSALVSAVRSALRARRRQYQIREHLIERERAEEALRKADRRKDEFLAILAHELRNPLAPIRNSLHVLQLTGRDDPAARRVAEMMERQVSHMVRLVDDLLEVSRITRGKIELRREELDVGSVIQNAIETSRPLIDAGGHALAVQLPPEHLAVHGDGVRLAQVFSNLLNNAAKYTDPHGTIEVAARRDGDAVVVSVKDSGTGIPADMLPRVFELFTQVDGATNRAHGGLGIGLTLVKNLVEMHGGSIDAKSDGPGKGSEFVVRLPLSSSAAADVPKPAAPASAPLSPRRVLVVDDNRDAADSLAMLLRLLGATVRVVNGGRDALKLLDDYVPDIMLLDIGMPGMDGYEVARRVRERSELNDVTLVALTGWGQDEDRRRSRSAGFDHHLIKPADVGEIKALLASLQGRCDPPPVVAALS
jgi:signal transduction histidine kinase/ActR/RegA family two-component response regulator